MDKQTYLDKKSSEQEQFTADLIEHYLGGKNEKQSSTRISTRTGR